MASAKLSRWSGLAAMIGGAMWTASWILVSFTEGGTRAVLGLSERGWRTLLLSPAMLFFLAGLVGFHRKQRERSGKLGKIGFVVGLLGVVAMLLGNIAEFWVFELFYGTQQRDWAWMGVGFMLLRVSPTLLTIGTYIRMRDSSW